MQTSPEQGQFLHLLARLTGAKKTLEVGVFLGYSSTWVALALPPGGKIIACDVSEEYTARGATTLARGRRGRQDRTAPGPALETLDALIAEGQAGSFRFRLHRRRQIELRELLRARAGAGPRRAA